MCAGAHLDPEFAHRVVKELFEQQHRAVGPSYGIDLVPILRHCFAARRRRLVRDIVLLSAVLLAFVPNPLLALLIIGVLAFVGRNLAKEGWLRSTTRRRAGGLILAFIILVVILVVTLGPVRGAGPIPLVLLGPTLLAAVNVEQRMARRAVAKLRVGRFDPEEAVADIPRQLAHRLRAIEEAQFGNTTVYSGYDPFVGAGVEIVGWGWSDTIDLSKRKATHDGQAAAERFSVVEILAHVTEQLKQRLGSGDPLFTETSGMPITIENRAFLNSGAVHGASLLPDPKIGPPSIQADTEFITKLIYHPGPGRRHYLSIQVGLWGNEVVLTTFLYIDIKGGTLYVEAIVRVLYPIKAEYHRVDFMGAERPTVSERDDDRRSRTVGLPGTVLGAPANILRTLTTPRRAAKQRGVVAQDVDDGRLVDYGARVSVRELGAAVGFHEHFQLLDTIEAYKLTHRHIFDVILEFLDARGIDTEEFRERQTTILNTGIMLGQGTILNQGNFAVGHRARAGNQSGGDQPSRDQGVGLSRN